MLSVFSQWIMERKLFFFYFYCFLVFLQSISYSVAVVCQSFIFIDEYNSFVYHIVKFTYTFSSPFSLLSLVISLKGQHLFCCFFLIVILLINLVFEIVSILFPPSSSVIDPSFSSIPSVIDLCLTLFVLGFLIIIQFVALFKFENLKGRNTLDANSTKVRKFEYMVTNDGSILFPFFVAFSFFTIFTMLFYLKPFLPLSDFGKHLFFLVFIFSLMKKKDMNFLIYVLFFVYFSSFVFSILMYLVNYNQNQLEVLWVSSRLAARLSKFFMYLVIVGLVLRNAILNFQNPDQKTKLFST